MHLKQYDPDKEIQDLTGKIILVTGGSAGLGEETILRLAAHNPKCIYLCARSIPKAKNVISKISEKHPNAHIEPVHLDLSSLKSVKSAAENIIAQAEHLDLLFLNAGVSATAPALTDEGYEWQFGVNYLGHVYFAQLLTPLLLRTAEASAESDVRVITVASPAAKMHAPKEGILFSDLKSDMKSYGPIAPYGQSKLANILFARKFAQMYPALRSVAVLPGLIKTEILTKADGMGWRALFFKPLMQLIGLSVEEGTRLQLWAGSDKGAESGKAYVDIAKEDNGGPRGNDQGLIDKLWEWTTSELAEYDGKGWP